MRIITKRQEQILAEHQRRLTEKKLQFMGKLVAQEMLNRVGWKDEVVPDLSGFIRNVANDISYSRRRIKA